MHQCSCLAIESMKCYSGQRAFVITPDGWNTRSSIYYFVNNISNTKMIWAHSRHDYMMHSSPFLQSMQKVTNHQQIAIKSAPYAKSTPKQLRTSQRTLRRQIYKAKHDNESTILASRYSETATPTVATQPRTVWISLHPFRPVLLKEGSTAGSSVIPCFSSSTAKVASCCNLVRQKACTLY